jgi:hypothetical protein
MIEHEDYEQGEVRHVAHSDPMSIALTLLAVAADPAATKKRFRELDRAEKAAIEAEARRQAAEAEAAKIIADANAQAAKTQADWRALWNELEARQNRIKAQEELGRSYREADGQERRQVLRYLNLLQEFDERLQSLPSWADIQKFLGIDGADYPTAAPPQPQPDLTDTGDNPHADRHGLPFIPGSTLARDLSHKRAS